MSFDMSFDIAGGPFHSTDSEHNKRSLP
jgi:hypothetical protein